MVMGTLTEDQKSELAAMSEEEKLAYDLYAAFDAHYDPALSTRIAKSESKHLDAVCTLLERYELTDPTVGLEADEFLTDDTQDLYDTLLAEGSVSVDTAMEAGRAVEETDIADLTIAVEGVTAPDVLKVYERLLAAFESTSSLSAAKHRQHREGHPRSWVPFAVLWVVPVLRALRGRDDRQTGGDGGGRHGAGIRHRGEPEIGQTGRRGGRTAARAAVHDVVAVGRQRRNLAVEVG
ncbi:DUF2202 domain-containing protein [Cryobacterium sandaracinum]|uniref:DUF2202 domain-containing protein n=1 Tax=Cryobacterium sandaracinum TaxID=1259247 RepID=A0ABY2J8J3_9MICO|nr:DUF2202 domain-containing protein [Cryobacterium sandaracinum]